MGRIIFGLICLLLCLLAVSRAQNVTVDPGSGSGSGGSGDGVSGKLNLATAFSTV